jgi:hypothetical protein
MTEPENAISGTSKSIPKTYTTVGTKTARVVITDAAAQTTTINCAVQAQITAAPVTTTNIKVTRFGGDLAWPSTAPATQSFVKNGSNPASTIKSDNPADFREISLGSYTVSSTDLANYTETAGHCTYIKGAAGNEDASECVVSSFNLTPTCANGYCTVSAPTEAGKVTKVGFRYSANTGDAVVVKVDTDGNLTNTPNLGTIKLGSDTYNNANEARYTNIASGEYYAYAYQVAGYTINAAICGGTQAAADCNIGNLNEFKNDAESLNLSCTGTECSYRLLVSTGQKTKVAFMYVPIPVIPEDAPTVDLVATPNVVGSGDDSTLSWTSTNAQNCSATWTTSTNVGGSQLIENITAPTTYSITCTNSDGVNATDTVTITLGGCACAEQDGKAVVICDGQLTEQCAGTCTDGACKPQCSDGVNNDPQEDTLIDFPADPGCSSSADDLELGNPVVLPQCSDNINNDGAEDSAIDYPADPGCTSRVDDTESPNPVTPPQCSDGIDNEDPEDASSPKADFVEVGGMPKDPGCISAADNDESDSGEVDIKDDDVCNDGRDTDGNGVIDTCGGGGGGTDQVPECSDGVDNYDVEDTLKDAQDPGCITNGTYNPLDPSEINSGTITIDDEIVGDKPIVGLRGKIRGSNNSYSAGPLDPVAPGSDVQIRWVVGGGLASYCTALSPGLGWTGDKARFGGVETITAPNLETGRGSYVYRMTCTNAWGASTVAQFIINVVTSRE